MQPTILSLLAVVLVLISAGAALLFYRRWRAIQRRVLLESAVHRRNEAIVDASGEGVLELDTQGMVCFANPAAARLLGYEPEELLGKDYRSLMTAGELPEKRDSARIGYTTDMLRGIGAMLRCKNGRTRPVEYRMVPLRHNGTAASLIAFRDLTERSRIDVMLADMQHLARVGAWELNVGSARLSVSEGISRRLHLSAGRTASVKLVLKSLTLPARHALLRAARAAIDGGQSFDLELQLRGQGNDWLRCLGKAERLDGATLRLYGTLQDVTERKQAESTLRDTRDFFGATLDSMPSLVVHVNQAQQLTYCNQSSLRDCIGLASNCLGQSLTAVLDATLYADLIHGIKQALAGHSSSLVRALTDHEESRQVHCSFVPQRHGAASLQGCFMVLTDVTELKLLEARLYQAEKMQAVGQLTGGVAHDFNNLLGVILGNLQLIERDVNHDTAVSRKLATAMRAAMRGTELTKRLLSFARRQVLDPVIIDLSHQLRLFAELIQRTLGDTVEMRLEIAPDLWHIKVDLGQLENAILNLVINSRDAMPNGGRLTVAARNLPVDATFFRTHTDLEQGEYVEISVTDTGTGIPPQVLSRVFEPFFTTKEIGKGSGLGLSMVHGFGKQSGGTVLVHSELGKGTRISMILPRCLEVQTNFIDTLVQKGMPGGNETILVVEDDTDLRATTVLALQRLGYRVLEASTGEAALRLLNEHAHIDMLFTDVIIPGGILGPELALRAREIMPGIQVLLTTGYLGDPLLTKAGPLAQEAMLAKPYRNEVLALQIRNLLD
ncbi:MAG: PAS domain-containing protein [Steroidobacteraceae bacterium]